ncbi:MAG: altronate dehydratase [Proteobacteria bacterium]|nr:altronate dehydratase [Pseudomonadota bacterium]
MTVATETSAAAPRSVHLNPADNVIVAVDPIAQGAVVRGVTAAARVARGHKMATAAIAEGAPVLKFGQIIGFASKPIAPGEWVHEHNVAMKDFARDYRFAEAAKAEPVLPVEQRATFQGYRRANGKVGTRNYLGVLTSVNCSATVARLIAREIEKSDILADYPNVDGVIPLVHGTGCGMATKGEGYDLLKRAIWGYAANPNMAGVLMVGLGCEAFQIAAWKSAYGIQESDLFRSFTIQDIGGTRRAVEGGVEAIRAMLPLANAAKREAVPASEIVLALQCGGSDGYSGITANPALGAAVDQLVRHGGTAILSETPEIYGAEHLLTRRAATREIGEKLVQRIRWWEDYTARNHGEMNNNPSPGNKAGGLTTILEKSLGAAAKGGTTTLTGVFEYAEPVTAKGFVFMDTPGFDPVSATGQVAGGANVLCFTTGRGSAYGCKPTPSIKLATNSDIYGRMTEDMDINCGDILDGVSVEAKGREIFETVLRVASGERSKSEALGYGDAEFVPWLVGAVM